MNNDLRGQIAALSLSLPVGELRGASDRQVPCFTGRTAAPVTAGSPVHQARVAVSGAPVDARQKPSAISCSELVPGNDIGRYLQPDRCIRERLQDPVLSLRFFYEQVDLRQEMERQGLGDKYTFGPFLVTLENMLSLTEHILAGRHFNEPLTSRESGAFETLQGYIRQMMDLQAPYKNTVRLAVLMTTVLEIVTASHVVADLRLSHPELLELPGGSLQPFAFCRSSGSDRKWQEPVESTELLLDRVLACRWGGLNPQGVLDEQEELFGGWHNYGSHVLECLDQADCFFYPTFEALSQGDICRSGHLPVFPLGMTTAYARPVAGKMLTPLTLMMNDAMRADAVGMLYYRAGSADLAGVDRMLWFRQQVLDHRPEMPDGSSLERAVEQVFFSLLHNSISFIGKHYLEQSSFLPLLYTVLRERRVDCAGQPVSAHSEISDREILVACRWVHWVHSQLQQDPGRADSAGRDLADRFAREELPEILEQWRFLDAHRAAVQDWFVSQQTVETSADGRVTHCWLSENDWACRHFRDGAIPVLQEHNRTTGGPVDYTDLAYFDVLQDPAAQQQMMGTLCLTEGLV